MPQLAAVIFDMDGVLVDSTELHFAAFVEFARRIDRPFTREQFDATYGMHNDQMLEAWFNRPLQSELAAQYAREKEEIYRATARTGLRPLAGVPELVQGLHALGAKLAVGSSGPRENVALAVEVTGLAPYFSALVTGDDVDHAKPAPDIFLLAARKLGVTPAECLVLEDAPQGVEAARRAGMSVIAVTSSRSAQALRDADRVVDSLEELDPRELLSGGLTSSQES